MRKRFCLRGHDTSIKGRDTQNHCRVCMAEYERSAAGKATRAEYRQSAARKASLARFQASPKRRRYLMLYNRTTRYSRYQDGIIGRLEEKREALLANL